MSHPSRSDDSAILPRLRVWPGSQQEPAGMASHKAWWRINGHRVCIHVWTVEEWASLDQHPTDAQYYPCGVWCALRSES